MYESWINSLISLIFTSSGKYYAVTQGMEIRSKSNDAAVTNYLLDVLDSLETV